MFRGSPSISTPAKNHGLNVLLIWKRPSSEGTVLGGAQGEISEVACFSGTVMASYGALALAQVGPCSKRQATSDLGISLE